MRVRRDGEPAALLLRGADQVTGQIEPLRAGVDLEKNATFGCFRGHTLEIESIWLTLQEHAPCQVPQDSQGGRLERPQQPIRHLLRFQVEVAMNTADDEIELGQTAEPTMIDPESRQIPAHRPVADSADIERATARAPSSSGQ